MAAGKGSVELSLSAWGLARAWRVPEMQINMALLTELSCWALARVGRMPEVQRAVLDQSAKPGAIRRKGQFAEAHQVVEGREGPELAASRQMPEFEQPVEAA